jgi:hypothetical protein
MKSVIILGERLFVFFPLSLSLKMISVPVGPAVVHSSSHHIIIIITNNKVSFGIYGLSNGQREGGNIGPF